MSLITLNYYMNEEIDTSLRNLVISLSVCQYEVTHQELHFRFFKP